MERFFSDFDLGRATVVVSEDQLSLAIGKHGQNVRLAARLTGWDIDILTPGEYNAGVERLAKAVAAVEDLQDSFVDNLLALGIISVLDLEEVGADTIVGELELAPETAASLVTAAAEEAKKMIAEKQQKQAENIMHEEKQEVASDETVEPETVEPETAEPETVEPESDDQQ
jgi:N utilization substance protein A